MKCPVCEAAGQKSKLFESQQGIATYENLFVERYFDEDGKYHVHGLRGRAAFYHCSNRHRLVAVSSSECPAKCGAGEPATIEEYREAKGGME